MRRYEVTTNAAEPAAISPPPPFNSITTRVSHTLTAALLAALVACGGAPRSERALDAPPRATGSASDGGGVRGDEERARAAEATPHARSNAASDGGTDANAPGDAGTDGARTEDTGAAADADALRRRTARVCIGKVIRDLRRRGIDVDFITSVQNLRAQLASFGRVCRDEFPELASAAATAAPRGRAHRTRVFGELVRDVCPNARSLASGSDVIRTCPEFVGRLWAGDDEVFLRRIDAGTFVFSTLLLKLGFDSFALELSLQSSLHPELDP
jgi:hypothetical protein